MGIVRRLWTRGVISAGYYRGPRVMSWVRKRWVLLRNPHADIRFAGPVYLGPGFSLHMPQGGTFHVGVGVDFRRGFRAELGPGARVVIGDGCNFTNNMLIQCATTIEIGKGVSIGQSAFVADGNHRYRDVEKPLLEQGYDFRAIKIGDYANVLSKVTIVNDIGERSLVAANAVVAKPVPPFCLAAGVPARVIDYFGPPGGEPEGLEPPP